ncbi:MAG TPA: carbohydrate ABC transporter permease [Thermomicrobiales bacterium]|jgi:trehalose transport system permease protein|nr:carbohydrate ABC transporter permease [Thermomicrobiales bacterium]
MSDTVAKAALPDAPQTYATPGKRFPWGDVIFWVVAVAVAFLVLAPLYVLVKVSLSTLAQATAPHPSYLIHNPTWDNWNRLLNWDTIGGPLTHSLIVATGTAILAILFAAPAAYVISRLPRKYRYLAILSVLFTRMFPEVIIATPIASNFFSWGLNDTNVGLILAHLIRCMPLATWILVGSFASIPRDLEESSAVDGASKVKTLIRVVLPLGAPGIAVAAIFAWLDSWNDLLYAIYLFLTERTLPLLTYYYANRGNVTDVATFSVILTIPVVIITLFLQRWIKSGTLSGAVKG